MVSRRLSVALVRYLLPIAIVIGTVASTMAQRPDFRRRGRDWDERYGVPTPKRDIFPGNKFTFARVRYGGGGWYGSRWRTDFPASDLNFSMRLAELTTIEVSRKRNGQIDHVVVRLTDEELFNYPFIYMLEVGSLEFSEEEATALRSYLLRGGFLLVDDFWGDGEWANWEYEIGKVFPPDEYPMTSIPLSHEIFHCVFEIDQLWQIPSIYSWMTRRVTYERGRDTMEVHCKGIFDKNGRLMAVVMHNTDLGDGWEREAENPEYFSEFSVKRAYPLGINIVVYAMTH